MAENIGKVIQISGPAVDVQFEEATMPPIYQALRVISEGFDVPHPINVILEVQQHLGEGRVRCVAMEATEGMVRGMKAIDTGGPITVPVGRATLGRVLNVIGEPVDELGPVNAKEMRPIHRQAPAFDEQSTSRRDVRDRRQGHRPHPAISQGRQDRPLRRRRRRQDGRHSGADQQRRHRSTAASRSSPASASVPAKATISGSSSRSRASSTLKDFQKSKAALIYGQMTEPPGARLRVALTGLTVAEYFRDEAGRGHAALHRQHLPLHPGGLRGLDAAGPYALRRRLPAEPGHRNGRAAGAHHLHQDGLRHLGAGHLRARRRS